jgi:hypothetical protein
MPSIIDATTSNGIAYTADNSGILHLRGNGNTGISISASGVPTITAPTFSGIVSGLGSQSVASYLAADVTMTLANTWYDGPNTGSIGANGQIWVILAKGEITNAGAAVAGEISIHDGTTFLTGGSSVGGSSTWTAVGVGMYFVTLTGPTTFTLKAAGNAASSALRSTTPYYSVQRSTWIVAIRLA